MSEKPAEPFWTRMTPEELEDWITNVRPILIEWQERSREVARRGARNIIRRPARRREDENQ